MIEEMAGDGILQVAEGFEIEADIASVVNYASWQKLGAGDLIRSGQEQSGRSKAAAGSRAHLFSCFCPVRALDSGSGWGERGVCPFQS